jgi:hypothetical protein
MDYSPVVQRPHMAMNGNVYVMSEDFQITRPLYNSNGAGNRFRAASMGIL